jgi:outer membrane protein assembly factor BamB
VGAGISWCEHGTSPADCGRRPRIRRQPGWDGLFARRQNGLHGLDVQGEIRRTNAVVLGTPSGASTPLYFGDGRSNVYALNASTGAQLWTQNVETHPYSHITGAPALYQNRLYVPVASGEEGQGNNKNYECCTFRGSLVALNIANGNVV